MDSNAGGNGSVWSDPSRRNLFRYHDGTKARVGDPLEIARKLLYESGIDFKEDLGVSGAGPGMVSDEMRITAMGRLSKAIRDAFGVEPLGLSDSGDVIGMSDNELFDHVLAPFVAYVDGLKKSGAPT